MKVRGSFGVIMTLGMFFISGCGGGGGTTAPPTSTSAVVKLKTASTTVASMASIQVTVTLPAGVTVKTAADGTLLPGIVTPSGVVIGGNISLAGYVPSGAGPAKLTVGVAGQQSFGVGEFATINVDIAPGVTVNSSSFTLDNIVIYQSFGDNVIPVPAQDVTLSAQVVL